MSKLVTTVRVRVTLEFGISGGWDKAMLLEKVYELAREEAEQALRHGFAINGVVHSGGRTPRHATIIDQVRPIVILSEEKD